MMKFVSGREKGVGWARCALGLAALTLACREVEPPRSYYADLGNDQSSLLPPPPTWLDSGLKDGQAEWFAFPQVTPEILAERAELERAKPKTKPVEPADEPSDSPAPARLEEYNRIVAEKRFEDALAFFVDRQRETFRQAVNLQQQMMSKIELVLSAMEEKSPGAGEPLKKLLDSARENNNLRINVVEWKPGQDNDWIGTLPTPPVGMPVDEKLLTVRLVQVEEAWLFELPSLEALAAMEPMITAALGQFDTIIEGLKSGAIPADGFSQQLSSVVDALRPLMGTQESDAAKDDAPPEKEPDEKPDGE